MNPLDRDNLDWYMTAPEAEIQEWLEIATAGDLDYMMRLVRVSRSELYIQQLELLDEQPEILAQTKDILERYTL